MENDVMSGEQEKEPRGELTLPLIILSVLIFACFLYVYQNRDWLVVLKQIGAWLVNPEIHYTPIHVKGVLPAIFATIQILILGTVASRVLLKNEEDKFLHRICAVGLGLGFTGLITISLGIFGVLYKAPLNIGILLLIVAFLLRGSLHKQRRIGLKPVWSFLRDSFSIWKIRMRLDVKSWSLFSWALRKLTLGNVCTMSIGIIVFLTYYQALFAPIVFWDSLVSHAVMPNIMYIHHEIPLIAGSSHGLEMSSNYPPLFYAIGAYFYIQIGGIEDFYLKAISPTMAFLTILVVYKIGKSIAGDLYGKISALFLSTTPLFILYSMFCTYYMIFVFFITISVLFMLLALKKKRFGYWIISGVFYGISLLTTYNALFLLPLFFGIPSYIFIRGRYKYKILIGYFLPIFTISGIWYIRNLILLGNPVFPYLFGGKYANQILGLYFDVFRDVGLLSYFGTLHPSIFEWFGGIIFNFQHFPSFSILTFVGAMWVLLRKDRNLILLLIWALLPCIVILSGLSFIFPRYFLVAIPPFALLGALLISKVLDQLRVEKDRRLNTNNLRSLIKYSIAIVLILIFLFPGLTVAIVGKMADDKPLGMPIDDGLYYFKNPGGGYPNGWHAWIDTKTWSWIDYHLKEGEKVATFDVVIYYIKNGDYVYFFPLDGWEAKELYHTDNPTEIVQLLRKNQVKYVFDVPWYWRPELENVLPLTDFLGSPWFPQIFKFRDGSIIYNVGPISTSITENSLLPIYINQQGWTDPQNMNGKTVMSVIAGSNYPRLYVATHDLTVLKITYLDKGTGPLYINLYNSEKEEWIIGFSVISRHDTGEWKMLEFLMPIARRGFVELGLYAYEEDFVISEIQAVSFQAPGKASLFSLSRQITNSTYPPTLMVYLPILKGDEKIIVETDSHGKNISVEVFEGVIQPQETTKWWERHVAVARSPSLPAYEQKNPTLAWGAKPGCYTLVIVLWDEFELEVYVDMSISIGGGN